MLFRKCLALAATTLPSMAYAASGPGTLNFCSGAQGGNYDFSAIQIAQQAKGILHINIINARGLS
jgi:hypothetical protein